MVSWIDGNKIAHFTSNKISWDQNSAKCSQAFFLGVLYVSV
jgi:hypothetical protein